MHGHLSNTPTTFQSDTGSVGMNSPFDQIKRKFRAKEVALEHLALIFVELPLKEVFHSSIGHRVSKQAIIIKWVDKSGYVGYGECSCRPDPYYAAEFLTAVPLLIEQFIFPKLLPCSTYGDVQDVLDGIRGWPFAKAAIDFAIHDMLAAKEGMHLLEEWMSEKLHAIPAGISISIYDDFVQTEQAAETALQKGFRRLKFKVTPKLDIQQFAKANFTKRATPLLFDANGSFRATDFELLAQIAKLGVTIEQPFPPGRLDWCLAAKKQIPELKICLDEDIKSIGTLSIAHSIGIIDELNLKPARVGGIFPSLAIIDFCQNQQLNCWIGGMFETGIGRSLNLQFAGLLPTAKAHDISPSIRYFREDLLVNNIKMQADGLIPVQEAFHSMDLTRLEKYTQKVIHLSK